MYRRDRTYFPADEERRIKLIIFDMDGVLFDSEPYHARAEKMMLSRCGIHEELGEQAGKSHADIWTPLIERYQLKISQPELERQQNALTMQLMRADAVPLHEGLKEVLNLLQANGIQAAVASSTSSDMVEEMLSYYRIREMFCCVKTGSNVKRRKPYPDIYQAVLRECCVVGDEALAVEDTDIGMRAALAAGIPCLGYRNPTSGQQKLDMGTATIERAEDILAFLTGIA
ncbi:MAG: HAD family phosphatase [Eubacteriales bacterium]|nr:HAD family phosphatase [Eubacteriales bacterium]